MRRGVNLKNKKGALDIGVGTVVILVIAMVIIASAITFIRGFFGMGQDQLGGIFENVGDFGLEPTASNPLVLTDGRPHVKSGDSTLLRVGVYNRNQQEIETQIDISRCTSTIETYASTDPHPTPIVNSLSASIEPGRSLGFATYIVAEYREDDRTISLLPGNYICNIRAIGLGEGAPEFYEETQITVVVTR